MKKRDKLINISLLLSILFLLIKIFKMLNLHFIFIKLLKVSSPIIFGYFLAWIFNPLYKKLNTKFSEKISLILCIILYIIIIGLILVLVLPNLYESIKNITTELKDNKYIMYAKKYLNIKNNDVITSCKEVLKVSGLFGLTSIFGFYFLYKYNYITSLLISFINIKYLKKITLISKNMRRYLKGLLIDTLCLFILTFILFMLIGLKKSILFASICAFTNIMPFVGPYIGGVPAVIFALSISQKKAILTLIIIVVTQIFESNFINPFIMSKCIKINPFVILAGVLFMGAFFGPLSMIFTMPALIVLKILVFDEAK